MEISELVAGLDPVDMTKYVKLFEKDGESRVGIYNSRIKALAKRKSFPLSPFPPVKLYPKEVKSGTQAFTKLTASSNVGQANTAAGYCMLINIQHLSSEARIKILEVLGKEDLPHDGTLIDEEEDDCDLLASQDFPNHFQSQTAETFLHCTLCEYMTRSKVEFETHLNSPRLHSV